MLAGIEGLDGFDHAVDESHIRPVIPGGIVLGLCDADNFYNIVNRKDSCTFSAANEPFPLGWTWVEETEFEARYCRGFGVSHEDNKVVLVVVLDAKAISPSIHDSTVITAEYNNVVHVGFLEGVLSLKVAWNLHVGSSRSEGAGK